MRSNRATAAFAACALSLSATPLSAKVSTSAVLCFRANDRSVSSTDLVKLSSLVEQSRGLGPIVALFVVTIRANGTEPAELSTQQAGDVIDRLVQQGFKAEANEVRMINAPASGLGCSPQEVAVEIEALFPHDGYR